MTMVGVINPNDTMPLSIQRQNAGQQKISLSPGQPFPKEGEETSDNTKATPSSPSTSSTSSPAPQSTPHSGGSSLSGGAVAGIVIAAIFVVGLLGAVFFLLGRQKGFVHYMPRPRSKENIYPAIPGHPGSPHGPAMGQYYAPWAYPDAHYGDQHYVAAPPYKHAPPPQQQTRSPHRSRQQGHGPAELPSPGGNIEEPLEPHPALRGNNSGLMHKHSHTASSIVSRDIPIGISRNMGSKSSQILGTSYHGAGRNTESRQGVREAPEGSDISAPSPPPTPKPRSRDGPPQLRPLSWWGRKKSQKG